MLTISSCAHKPTATQSSTPRPKSRSGFVHGPTRFKFPLKAHEFELLENPIREGGLRETKIRVAYTIRRAQTQPILLEIYLSPADPTQNARESFMERIRTNYPKARSLDDSDFKLSNTEKEWKGFRLQWVFPGVNWSQLPPSFFSESTESVGDTFVFVLNRWRIEFNFLYLEEERKIMRNNAQDLVRDMMLKANEKAVLEM